MIGQSATTRPKLQASRRIYDAMRNLPDRLLHSGRHLAAMRRLSRAGAPRQVLVVCHANLCRSPYMAAVLQRMLPGVAVSSAGFMGMGRPVPHVSVALGAKRGLDLSSYRSRPLTRDAVSAADVVITMEPEHADRIARSFRVSRDRIVIAGDLDPIFGGSRSIKDPWNESTNVIAAAFDRLDRCAETIAGALRRDT